MQLARITGTGAFLPGPPIDNRTLAKLYGRRLIWLCKKLGSNYRHAAVDLETRKLRDGLSNSEMAYRAALSALENAGLLAAEIDLIVAASATPDLVFPAGALMVQDRLGLQDIKVIELRAGCGGMVQAFAIAKSFLENGMATKALLIGTEFVSPYSVTLQGVDQKRRLSNDNLATLAMMGDGAGAVTLELGDSERGGIRAVDFVGAGVGRPPGLTMKRGGALAALGEPEGVEEGFRHDLSLILEHSADVLLFWQDWAERKGVDLDRVDYIIPPQATTFAIRDAMKKANVSMDRAVNLFEKHANTASAGLYIALDHMHRSGMLKPGDRIHMLPAEASKWVHGVIDVEWSLETTVATSAASQA